MNPVLASAHLDAQLESDRAVTTELLRERAPQSIGRRVDRHELGAARAPQTPTNHVWPEVERRGRTSIFTRARLLQDGDALVATGTSTLSVLAQRQTGTG